MELHDYDAAAVSIRAGHLVDSHIEFLALLLLLMIGRWLVLDVWKRGGGK